MILELYGYRNCGADERQKLEAKSQSAATVSAKPIYIFRELIHYLAEQRIVAPGYSFMQEEVVGKALTHEENRLTGIVQEQLQDADKTALDLLLEESTGLHEITQLKHEPKDFTSKQIKREIERGEQIRPLYELAQKLLLLLSISCASGKRV